MFGCQQLILAVDWKCM